MSFDTRGSVQTTPPFTCSKRKRTWSGAFFLFATATPRKGSTRGRSTSSLFRRFAPYTCSKEKRTQKGCVFFDDKVFRGCAKTARRLSGLNNDGALRKEFRWRPSLIPCKCAKACPARAYSAP